MDKAVKDYLKAYSMFAYAEQAMEGGAEFICAHLGATRGK